MPEHCLSQEEKVFLLRLARQSIELAVQGQDLPVLDFSTLTESLCGYGVTFVTLTRNGRLRGCIGALEAYQPLVEDVREHAVAAALSDWRFPPVQPAEIAHLHIEISRLTTPQAMEYNNSEDLIERLRPGIDGVLMQHAGRRATFLPQVWTQLPSVAQFLSALAEKMGSRPDLWRDHRVQISTYQVEEFEE